MKSYSVALYITTSKAIEMRKLLHNGNCTSLLRNEFLISNPLFMVLCT